MASDAGRPRAVGLRSSFDRERSAGFFARRRPEGPTLRTKHLDYRVELTCSGSSAHTEGRRSRLWARSSSSRPTLRLGCRRRRNACGETPFGLRLPDNVLEEHRARLVLQQARAILAECRRIERRRSHVHVEEPAEEEAVLEVLAELALAWHGVQRDEQLRLQQRLRRDRSASRRRVHRVELRRHLLQRRIDMYLDLPQRVVVRHDGRRRNDGKHRAFLLFGAVHRGFLAWVSPDRSTTTTFWRAKSTSSPPHPCTSPLPANFRTLLGSRRPRSWMRPRTRRLGCSPPSLHHQCHRR